MSADPILIKRYPRSRFYHPSASRYVSLETLRVWASAGIDFGVRDAETGADITRVVLTWLRRPRARARNGHDRAA